jgi:hypothetical protein
MATAKKKPVTRAVSYVAAVDLSYPDGVRIAAGETVPADRVEKWLVDSGKVVEERGG